QASVDGERLAYVANYPPAGSVSDGEYLVSSRAAGSWSTVEMIPPQSTEYSLVCKNAYIIAYSPDLSSSVLADGLGQTSDSTYGEGSLRCGTDEPSLVTGEPEGFQNLFLRNTEAPSYQLLNLTPAGLKPSDAWFQAGSQDLSHIFFDESAQLLPQAPVGDALYDWTDGVLRLVTILPDGTIAAGKLANAVEHEPGHEFGKGPEVFTHAVSIDGSHAFFVANERLYAREHPEREQSALVNGDECTEPEKACTVQMDTSQVGG